MPRGRAVVDGVPLGIKPTITDNAILWWTPSPFIRDNVGILIGVGGARLQRVRQLARVQRIWYENETQRFSIKAKSLDACERAERALQQMANRFEMRESSCA